MTHTPTPWKAEKTTTRGEFCWNYHVRAQDESMICTIGPCNQDANTQFIVRACNAHEELVSLLDDAVTGKHAISPDWYTRASALVSALKKGA